MPYFSHKTPPQDGIFHNLDTTNSGGRFCVNCHRGSLWPAWCGRKKTNQPYWDLQQCEATITRMAIESAGEHECVFFIFFIC
jgi:hypothetical protein